MFTKFQLYKQLEDMQAPTNKPVLVHSALKTVGETEGRGEGFLGVLIDYFTSNGGLLCIPTHTWANLSDKSKITLDLITPSTCIGTLPNIAAKRKDAIRSMHPTHSMAVFGEKGQAIAFVKGENAHLTPANPNGCYGKIFDNDGYILLVGVVHNRNTYLHCVEEMLGISNRIATEPQIASIRHLDGSITNQSIYPHEAIGIGDVSLRYVKYEPAFRYHGAIVDGYVGNAKTQLCNARKMKEVMELIYNRSGGTELFSDYEPLNEKLYM